MCANTDEEDEDKRRVDHGVASEMSCCLTPRSLGDSVAPTEPYDEEGFPTRCDHAEADPAFSAVGEVTRVTLEPDHICPIKWMRKKNGKGFDCCHSASEQEGETCDADQGVQAVCSWID